MIVVGVDLFFGIVFGAIGSGYLLYAKREFSAAFAVTGFLLIVYPYFLSNAVAILLVGALLVATPFVVRKYAA